MLGLIAAATHLHWGGGLQRSGGTSGGRGDVLLLAASGSEGSGARGSDSDSQLAADLRSSASSFFAAVDGGNSADADASTTRLRAELVQARSERDAALAQLGRLHLQAAAAANATAAAQRQVEPGSAACPDRHTPWAPSAERDNTYPELAQFLSKVAIGNEVLVAVSNANYARPGGMLEIWAENVRRAGVGNSMVVALDDEAKQNAESFGVPAFRMDVPIPDSQKDVGSNHAVSALKFRILAHFMKLGYSVFLSDVDIIFLQNPFDHLHRDSDVEGMSDGWDHGTAYGYDDVQDDASMGWARYAHSMRIFVLNSGLFYLRSTQATIDLLNKLIRRIETESGWDQALFNECIFFPSSPSNKDPSVTRRVLDYMLFMNSKVLFKHLRHDQGRFESHKPVSVHVNSHPDKLERMKAVVKRYVDGDMHGLDGLPDGSQ
ncbi:hypothetical protein ABPG75_004140 [Micractinium tetrahymenae]